MTNQMKPKRSEMLQFRVSPDEYAQVIIQAKNCGISCSEYFRRLALGYSPAIKIDQAARVELCKVAGDLGRLGGLLKLWMAQKRSTSNSDQDSIDIRSIDSIWDELRECVRVLRQRITSL